jgi:outer membrane receptor protein involved in Fe transport
MDIEQLMDLKVTTASLFQDKLSDAPSIISVVTSDELRRFGGMTLGEILQRVTGLTVSSQYFTDRSLIAARGDQTETSGGHILFLINGRPTREVMEGGIISDLIESFPVDILDHIEIIRGPGSVLYGSNAFSAVINLITIKADRNQLRGDALGGDGGALASSVRFLYQRGDFNIVGASQIHQLPDWPLVYIVPPPLRDLPTAPPEPAFHDTSLVNRGAGDYLGVNYKGLSFMSSFTEWQSTSFAQGSVGKTRLTRDFGDLGYDYKTAANWDMDFNVTYTRTTFSEVPYPSTARDSNEFVAEWTNLITLTSKDRLTAGVLFSRIAGTELYTATVPSTISAKGSRPAGGFYAQLDHQLLHSLKLIAGFQSNKIGSIPFSTVPRVGAIWSPWSWSSIKVLYGEAFRAPSLDETLLDRPGIIGNPNLLPEKVGTFDLGFGLQFTHLQLSVDYFHSRQTDSIVTVGNAPIHYINLGDLTFNGVELEGKHYFRKDFFTQGSLLYQTNQNANGINNVTPIPNWGFKTGLSYENDRGLVLGLFDVSDGRITPYPGTVNPVQGWHNNLNANLSWDLSKYFHISERNKLSFVAHGNNLFGHSVWLPGFGFHSIDSIPVTQGRTAYFGLQLSFGKN